MLAHHPMQQACGSCPQALFESLPCSFLCGGWGCSFLFRPRLFFRATLRSFLGHWLWLLQHTLAFCEIFQLAVGLQ